MYFYFCMKLRISKNSSLLISEMTIIFSNSSQKIRFSTCVIVLTGCFFFFFQRALSCFIGKIFFCRTEVVACSCTVKKYKITRQHLYRSLFFQQSCRIIKDKVTLFKRDSGTGVFFFFPYIL